MIDLEELLLIVKDSLPNGKIIMGITNNKDINIKISCSDAEIDTGVRLIIEDCIPMEYADLEEHIIDIVNTLVITLKTVVNKLL